MAPLLSDEHFAIDGTLIEAWASHRSFKPGDGSVDGDGADKAYDTKDHVAALRDPNVTPHVAEKNAPTRTGRPRQSAIDARTMRKTKHRSLARAAGDFMLNLIAQNSSASRDWWRRDGGLRPMAGEPPPPTRKPRLRPAEVEESP